MAKEYGWLPEQVNKLTLYQVQMYICDEKTLGGTASGDAATAISLSNSIKDRNRRQVQRLFERYEELRQ